MRHTGIVRRDIGRQTREQLIRSQGPYLVDGLDGSLHMVHMQFRSGGLKWEDQYRQKIRGEIPPRELDTEVRRLLGLGRRFDAFKAVR